MYIKKIETKKVQPSSRCCTKGSSQALYTVCLIYLPINLVVVMLLMFPCFTPHFIMAARLSL